MKHLLLTAACCVALTIHAPAQSIPAAIDQLAALQTLGHTIAKGYRTMTTGLDSIGSIRSAEYGLHNTYITGLDFVRPQVLADQKLQALRTQLTQLITRIRTTRAEWQ
ncbi:MAG TPA: hypothetical protein VGM89_02170 [Puia sp.]|jgi:hypothetical protein